MELERAQCRAQYRGLALSHSPGGLFLVPDLRDACSEPPWWEKAVYK
jgi:hypothetical protein